MKALPISFSAGMVRAILAGTKTMTRRMAWITAEGGARRRSLWHTLAPGDALWVREQCRAEELPDGRDGVRYAADDAWRPIENTQAASDQWLALRGPTKNGALLPVGPWRQPRFAPRWASRISLRVTAVHEERLRDISEADAIAEGVRRKEGGYLPGTRGDHIGTFAALWDNLHGEGAWKANPDVVVISFQRSEI